MAKVLWTQKQDIGPRARAGHAMTFDATRRRVVLFGGDSLDGTLFGDTWEWDGESWTQIQDIGPSPRAFHAIAFDSVRNRTVLFGGRDSNGRFNDTWEWDGESWTQVADSGPAARSGHAIAFDSRRQRIVLFGGESGVTNISRLNDTWEWDGDEWVQQADSGPSPRVHAAMAFDSTRNRLVLFGGATQDTGLGDTWEWDGTAWTEEADFGPDPCAGAAMVFKGARIALFGGMSSIADNPNPEPSFFGRSWEWNGRHWTARQDMGPRPRVFLAMAFDAPRSRVVLFGGATRLVGAAKEVAGDTWEQFDSEPATPTPSPNPQPQPGTGVLANVTATPNPATAGQNVTITVTLAAPLPVTVSVTLLLDAQPFGSMQIPAMTSDATFNLAIPVGQAPGVVVLTARTDEGAEANTPLTIEPAVNVNIASLSASPNPVAGGQMLTVVVTLTAPAPQATGVLLQADDQPIGSIPIEAGAVSGQVQLQIPPQTQPLTVVLRAVSGPSQAETTLQVVV